MRDLQDRWIRIWTRRGALLVVPEGIYHRFTLDEGNYIKVGAGQGVGTRRPASTGWGQGSGVKVCSKSSSTHICSSLTCLPAASGPQALRLFSGVPVWTPINRPAEEHPSRTKYLSAVAAA